MTDYNQLIFEANDADFKETVLERSHQIPVMVDFWAEWCAACLMLGPILEKMVDQYAGRIALAKVDLDHNQNLASQFSIRSIPAVKIFYEGKIIKEFLGAIPSDQVQTIIDEILPDEKKPRIEEANADLAGGRWEDAEKIYREILQDVPHHPDAGLGMGVIAFHQGRFNDAEEFLKTVTSETPGYEKVPPMMARIYFEKLPAPDLNEITATLKLTPEDPRALYSLAIIYARGGEYEMALETLLRVLRIDKEYEEGTARSIYLKIIEIIGRNSPEGKRYQRDLSMVLFS